VDALEAVDVFGGDAGLEGDPLPQGLPLEFLELLAGLGGLLLRLLEFGEVAVLEVLEALLEGLPLPPFLRQVGEDGVLVALAGLRVALVAVGPSPWRWWLPGVVSSGAVAASSGVVVVSCSDMGGSPSRSGCPARISRAGAGATPSGSGGDVAVRLEEGRSLGAVGREASMDGAHREPLPALEPSSRRRHVS
jgi:hypothetical protein